MHDSRIGRKHLEFFLWKRETLHAKVIRRSSLVSLQENTEHVAADVPQFIPKSPSHALNKTRGSTS
jgi:hypothetical protein